MSIHYFNEDVQIPKFGRRRITSWIKEVILAEEKKTGDISYIFCSDVYLLDVNRKYLNHDFFTDVITFDTVVDDVINGDIFISIDRVNDNANVFGVSREDEMNRILIHGILHLLGYKDKRKVDKMLMTNKENYYLKVLNSK